jgi:hypothetical protein
MQNNGQGNPFKGGLQTLSKLREYGVVSSIQEFADQVAGAPVLDIDALTERANDVAPILQRIADPQRTGPQAGI